MNIMSGTMAIFMAMYGFPQAAVLFILLGIVFDFFDGLAARLLHVKSELGKELDSLADVVTSGVAPAILAHLLIKMSLLGEEEVAIFELSLGQQMLLFSPLLIPAFSAYRLAKFNLDVRQTTSFIGMPTPATALFWSSLTYAYYQHPELYAYLFGSVWVLLVCVVILSVLLISELPMFSLKISGFSWQENKIIYCFLTCIALLLAIFGMATVVFIIPLYILISVIVSLKNTTIQAR